jgi:hypothetical protein
LLTTLQAAFADDPLVYKAGNTLVIEGNANANSVSLVGSKDSYSTIGVYINDVPQVFENVQNIFADLGDGDDEIAMDRIRIYGNVDVMADGGNNTIYLGGWGYGQSDIGGHVSMTTAGGNDYVLMSDCLVDNDVTILLGEGDNEVEFGGAVGPGIDPGANTFSSGLTVQTGDDTDVVRIMRTICWGQSLIETNGDDDFVILGPVNLVMAEGETRQDGPNDLKTRESTPDGQENPNDLKTREPSPDGETRTAGDLGFKATNTTHGGPATVAFSDLTILTGVAHDVVAMTETSVSGTALIQLWNGNDDLYLIDENYFYGTLTAQGGVGTDVLYEDPATFYSNAPTFLSF